MLPQLALYRPTIAESAKRRHPAFAARIEKASTILDGDLQLDQLAWDMRNVVRWRIASQSHSGAYIVCGLHCPCQDSRAQVVGNTRFCKHAIAVALYMKLLRNHFNGDVRRREIDLGILPDGPFNAYAPKLGICHIRKNGTTYDFADSASAVRYAIWVAAEQAAPQGLPVEWPVAHSVAVAA